MVTIDNYVSPEVEIIEVAVEKGFATSSISLSYYGEEDDVTADY